MSEQFFHSILCKDLEFSGIDSFKVFQATHLQIGKVQAHELAEKPIPRSNVMLTDGQGNQLGRTNWQLAGFSSGCEQDVSNYSGVAQHADQNDQLVRNGGDNIRNADIGHEVTRMGNNTGNHIVSQTPGLNSSLLASILAYPNIATFTSPVAPPSPSTCMVWRPSFPNLHAQVDGCGEPNLLVGNQARCWNLLSSSNISSQTHYEHPTMPCLPSHDLNSSPRIEADAASSVTTSFKSAVVVPDHAKRLENSSSAVISTPFEGEKDLARLDEQGIDLNKTPQKQPPKRRKHRPKVIVEDKPKRTPKVATTKNTDPKEKSTEKRKYIRKDLKEPAIQQTDSAVGTTPPSSAKRKYVRKKGLDESATQHTDSIGETINTRPVKRKYVRKKGLDESANQHADCTVDITHSTARRELRFDLETTTDERYSNAAAQEFMLNKKRGTSDLNTSLQVADSSTTTSQMNQLNSLWVENQQSGATSNQAPFMNQMQSSYTTILERQVVAAELTQRKIMHMENLNGNAKDARGPGQVVFLEKKPEWTRQITYQNTPQSVQMIPLYLIEGRGSKREHFHIEKTKTCTSYPVGSLADEYHQSIPGMGCLEVQKRYKTENGTQANTLSMSSRAATAKYPGECQLQPGTCNTEMSRIQQMSGATVSIPIPSGKGRVPQQPKDILKEHQQPSVKRRGRPAKQKFSSAIEEIVYHMECLSLNAGSKKIENKEQNALVPYKGGGTLVPYDGLEFVKKHKPRPKVDLDPESDRVWKLLMGKGNEGLEKTDAGKEQWWEEERKVFHGRVDSFIARMHLVQGDRRFSKWKGSVVDSVIGVFLTQNVSDHLSSSAFMSLASLFPLKSRSNAAYDSHRKGIMVEEPDVCMQNSNDIIKWNNKLRYPLYNQSSMTHHGSAEPQGESETWCIERASMVGAQSHSLEEEFVSSQDSFDSSTIQANEGVRSYSGSNSETEDPPTGCKPSTSHGLSSVAHLQMESPTLLEEFDGCESGSSLFHRGSRHENEQAEGIQNMQQGAGLERLGNLNCFSPYNQQFDYCNPQMQGQVVSCSNYGMLHMTSQSNVQQAEGFKLHHEETISSWTSNSSRSNKESAGSCSGKTVGQESASVGKTAARQSEFPRCQEAPLAVPDSFFRKQSMYEQSSSQPYYESQVNERNETLQWQSMPAGGPVNLAETLPENQNSYTKHISIVPRLTENILDVERTTSMNKQTPLENIVVNPNTKDKVHPDNRENLEANANASKARKGKNESEKKDVFDWDSLRKQVQTNGRKERTEDTMDSLDYEAVRCAGVNEISEAIKERGMNKILAERIQEFLNRLVREHGSIDLEWLRDVPPDKAKDYLLSIWGLGLKSVECVRLLTLHHLAFPVDTNVGRIAVRLGWVPLQPLPESLQLHLLELYPILESIQKYLWPRLCKLNQRTLYELHYQMITFGKVFCTKSRPNCNACPMRAECRHFASAFTSARLALPGPEAKDITTSTVPFMPEKSPSIVINPMPLPPPEDNQHKRIGFDNDSCEPIVEEPVTPDQEQTELTETDIEDFGEDPDEIPTIKLNMKEFTENLQNYIHTNMELQEYDMSKALVALDPNASIPTPKLKNVSRLRTEHQVYELPDSHPLLQGMDKREPDDPSPYLLAIWTPGETANSIEPPEQQLRGTLLIPCRTAMRGSFPLNGTYFQVNEMFADHESSLNPIDVPRGLIWNLPRRIVYFGTSVSSIFKGLSTEGVQHCFWKGFVCVRGFDQITRAPRPLKARLHFPVSRFKCFSSHEKYYNIRARRTNFN
ncbi:TRANSCRIPTIONAL ACTIVATOR DEMETER [Salix purpurea]|uniref:TRANSCRIPTIONAL ACTIVATOR DEMETER n=1 Tax=Salix purpurea TaxID=77065 RepID=A0A9Q0UC84_SALPP|nr:TRANSCRIPTIONAL ACTIVATOR DEMETER [Salix purpurea]